MGKSSVVTLSVQDVRVHGDSPFRPAMLLPAEREFFNNVFRNPGSTISSVVCGKLRERALSADVILQTSISRPVCEQQQHAGAAAFLVLEDRNLKTELCREQKLVQVQCLM